MIQFCMPSLGADMEQGTLLEWRVAPGDRVRRGDIVAVVDTEKAEIEVESWQEGTVEEILVPVGRTVPVGTPLATLREDGQAGEVSVAQAATAAPAKPVAAVPTAAPAAPAALPERPTRVRVSPLARRLAAERGLDLASLTGTGPEGAITRDDVEAATPAARVEPAPVTPAAPAEPAPVTPAAQVGPAPATPGAPSAPAAAPPDRSAAMRRAIAAAMQRSKREIPHYYLETSIDFGAAQAWLEAANRERPIDERLLPAALLLRAVALALRDVPELNGFWADDRLQTADAVHLGFAVSLRAAGGLLTPVLRDVDGRRVGEIMTALRDLVSRARNGRLRSSEVAGATCTITSLGDGGVEKVFGIIHPPQVALVGFGAVMERAWAHQGFVAARPVLTATLSADHRASDGQRGARFLARVARRLERPEEL